MATRFNAALLLASFVMLLMGPIAGQAASLPDTITRIKPAVVAVGTHEATRRPPAKILGTGFAVDGGGLVVTNLHVLPKMVDPEKRETLAVFQRQGDDIHVAKADVVVSDSVHDLVVLKVQGTTFKPLSLAEGRQVREGQLFAFTGFPIGGILGLRPVTHRGIVSSITPIALPTDRSSQLDPTMIAALRNPYDVYQLDATAYPGNSGSPLFDVGSGEVVGVINSVLVKKTKEAALEHPSGISYAIPVRFVRALLSKAQKR